MAHIVLVVFSAKMIDCAFPGIRTFLGNFSSYAVQIKWWKHKWCDVNHLRTVWFTLMAHVTW